MEGVTDEFVHQEGKVEFDIAISNQPNGDIRLRGTFPRIKPRKERPEVDGEIIQSLLSKLLNWIGEYFDISKRREDFQNLATTCVVFAVYIDPWSSFDSDVMELELQFTFWCSAIDDFIERSPPTAVKMIRDQNEYFQRIWHQDDTDLEPPKEVCDLFVPLCNSLVAIRDRMRLFAGFEEALPKILYYRRKYDRAAELVCSVRNQAFLNVDMFKYWRNIVFFMEGLVLTFAVLHDIVPGKMALESPYMARLFFLAQAYGFLTNDLLGVKKDVQTKEQNFVLFMLKDNLEQIDLQKKVNLCVEQICEELKEHVEEYIDLRARVLNAYPSDAKLEKFLDFCDAGMDGQLQTYVQGSRYLLTPSDSVIMKRYVND